MTWCAGSLDRPHRQSDLVRMVFIDKWSINQW